MTRSKHILLISTLLGLFGLGLLVLSYGHLNARQTTAGAPSVASRPSPTWAPFPTRSPGAPTFILPDLQPIHRALLRRDTRRAEAIWQYEFAAFDHPHETTADATGTSPHDLEPHIIAAVYCTGARLAMMQENWQRAEERVWGAILTQTQDATGWALLGLILRHTGDYSAAQQAFSIAEELDASLAPELFDDRWRVAQHTGDTAALVALAEDRSLRYPESPLTAYYRAEALLATNYPLDAVYVLVAALNVHPSAPPLLWYTLGRAYLARQAFSEAAVALEVAASRTAAGDPTLQLVSDDPITDLSLLLGQAYLGIGKCAEAEGLLRRLQSTHPELEEAIEQSVVCQTPTPTLTPWMPRMTPKLGIWPKPTPRP